MRVFKVFIGAVVTISGVATSNPALIASGAAMAIGGAASSSSKLVKSLYIN